MTDRDQMITDLIEAGRGVLHLGPSPDTRLPAVIYARRSKTGGTSVEDQVYGELEIAEENDWWVTAIVIEHGSASRHARRDREYWPVVCDMIRDREARVLLMFENSRSDRKLEGYVMLRGALIEAHALWEYGGRVYDMTNSDDRKDTAHDAIASEDESEKIRKRNLRTTKAQARRGNPHGPCGWGMTREYHLVNGKRVVTQSPDLAAVPYIRQAVDMILNGHNLGETGRFLTAHGVRSPRGGEWTNPSLRSTLLRPALAGLRVHQGKLNVVGNGLWAPVLADTREEAVQIHRNLVALLTDPARSTTASRAVKYLYTGLGVCGREGCGAKCNVRRDYYICPKSHVARPVPLVNRVVREHVIAMLSRPDALVLFRPATPGDALDRQQAELAALRARLQSFYVKAATGSLSADALVAIEAEMRPKIEALTKRLERVDVHPLVAEIAGSDVEARWDALTPTQQRAIVRTTFVLRYDPVPPLGRRSAPPESIYVGRRV